ncbi:hypothetical protein AXG93_2528s2200 [Marchantia polymorpha subsp. ruderalis]|uniref:Uncharacterized protein n=1 Tax=Marchantia polymorpha subsp. ruderalis TaxID=1480154 RepID=A0A176WQG0_MARPO|nr:hypothetical protein AXG93_2528s2200 [Marchantia polymorpha subsp. ruderalis]
MEGAGASIVSRASIAIEVTTRKMDSSKEEPELPRKFEDIIQRLEGKGEPITRLPYLFGKFFPYCASLSTLWMGWVRLRVLEAIGNCNTFEYLEVQKLCGGDVSSLTASERDLVLRGLRSSTVLREISVEHLRWNSDTEVESLCLQLGRILSTSSVTHLKINSCPLSARCFLNLASGLRGNSDSKLKELELIKAWEDVSAVKHVADTINSAPLLETLRLRGYQNDIEDETVGILSQALIQSSSLKELELYGVKWGAALLLKALAGDDGNRSIERLQLWYMDRIGDCVGELLTSNRLLKEVRLNDLEMSPEEWHQLGEVIRHHAIAIVGISLSINGDDWKSVEALACAASSDDKDPKVELELSIWRGHTLMLSLNLLGRVLRGEIKSLKSFSILAGNTRISATNQDRIESILSMNGKSGETSVLKRLQLLIGSENLLKGVWKDLLRCLRGNTSLTHLSLFEADLDEEAFRDLMRLLHVNFTLEEVDVSGTSWEMDGKGAQIQEVLKLNKKRAIYMSVFKEAKLPFGDAKAGRLFLCGSTRAGKTQLRKTLMRINRGNSYVSISSLLIKWEALWRTKGIEVELLQDNDKMQISVWDLAGSIIYIPNLDYIIVDPNWLTNNFLGELVALGQHFQAQDSTDNMMSNDSYTSKDGFVSESVFVGLIEKFLGKQSHGQRGVAREVLENILVNLDLCFKLEDTSQYFIPSFIPEHASMEEKKHHEGAHVESMYWENRSDTSQFVGIQIQCCPGVDLVLGVIQTYCVEMLIPSYLRGAILIEKLKLDFMRSIDDKLDEMPLESSHLVEKEELFHYEHCWPQIERHSGGISEQARDLLWESDVEAVVNEIRQKRIQQLELLQEGLISVDNDLAPSNPEDEDMIDQLVKKVDDLDERLRLVHSIMERLEMKMGQILSLQQELQSTTSDFMSKLDRRIEYSQVLQQARTPKRPYITDNVGLFYKMSALLHVGTTVRLHLMCEYVTGFHPAGLEKTMGLGQAIPEWEDLKSDIVQLDGISDDDRRAVLKGGESKELQEAWLRIQQTLAPQLQNRYSEIFKLYQVKYARFVFYLTTTGAPRGLETIREHTSASAAAAAWKEEFL